MQILTSHRPHGVLLAFLLVFCLQVMQVTCEACDMSGTRITADHPLTVLVGGDDTKVPGGGSRRDLIVEQLPPMSMAGTEYILVNLRSSTKPYGDYIKVIATDNGTTITFLGNTVTTTADRQVRAHARK